MTQCVWKKTFLAFLYLSFLSGYLLLGFCLLASAGRAGDLVPVTEKEAADVERFILEDCHHADMIKKADLDEDGIPEKVCIYDRVGAPGLLVVLKWNGTEYVKQWEYEEELINDVKSTVQDVTNDYKPEILLFSMGHNGRYQVLHIFTWDGKTYKLLGKNYEGEEYPFTSDYDAWDIAPGRIRVYEDADDDCLRVNSITRKSVPKTYKWNGSKFVLHGIRSGKSFASIGADKIPKIDGELDDWRFDKSTDECTYVMIGDEKQEVIFHPENWRGISDLGAKFDTQLYKGMFHIAVQITDDALVQEWQKASLWKGDHVELWFDVDLEGDFKVAKANSDDFQIGISPGNFKDIKPSIHCWLPKEKEGDIKGAKVSAKRTNNGYILEAAIPFQFLGIKLQRYTAEDYTIGFTLLVSDTDEKEKTQKCMIGTAPQYKWGNPTTWDNLTLDNLALSY